MVAIKLHQRIFATPADRQRKKGSVVREEKTECGCECVREDARERKSRCIHTYSENRPEFLRNLQRDRRGKSVRERKGGGGRVCMCVREQGSEREGKIDVFTHIHTYV